MPDKISAEIKYSVLEYTAVFKKPVIQAWTVPAQMIAPVLEALAPFGFTLDGVEVHAGGREKLSELAVVFKRTPAGITLTLSLSKTVLVAENVDWTEAESLIQLATAAFGAFDNVAHPEYSVKHLVTGIHIQIKDKPRQTVTAHLVTPTALALLDGDVQFQGILLQRGKAGILIDASVHIANGLFVRFTREHAAEASLQEMAAELRRDEMKLFDSLNLEGDL